MHFPFHLVIEYANTKPEEINRALAEFFGDGPLPKNQDEYSEELLQGLFGEWLIYEFRQKSGNTFISEYILKNPNKLSNAKISELEQIFKTQYYSEFQINRLKKGEYLELEDVFSGNKYRVYDKAGSSNSKEKGLLRARIAKVNDYWYLVGANPIYFPMSYTPRLKRILRRETQKRMTITVKDTAEILIHRIKNPPQAPKIPTKKELILKRKQLKEAYTKASIKYKTSLSFSGLITAIYEENRVNVLNFWKKLTKQGLPVKMMIEEFQLLQDIWNYFPHKCLGDTSPTELFAKLSQSQHKKNS